MTTERAESARSRWAWAVPMLALCLSALVIVLDPMALRGLRNAAFDQFQRWAPRPYEDGLVRIVDIDDESLRRIGQWPWSRARVAQLVDEIDRLQPTSTAMDIVFAEPDRHLDAAAPMSRAPDDALARALAQGNVSIGFAMTTGRPQQVGGGNGDGLRLKAGFLARGGDPMPFLPLYRDAVVNIPTLQEAAAGQGAMTFVPDDDGIVRQVPLVMNLGGRLVPSLAAEALRLASQHVTQYTVRSAGDGGGVVDVRIGEHVIATDAAAALWVHYSEPHPERYVPAWKILARQVPADLIRGHVVLVGSSAQGEMDLRFSPRGGIVPGVEVHAQALEQVLAGQSLSRPGWIAAVELIATLVGCLVVGVVAMRRGAASSFACFMALACVFCAIGWFAFTRLGLLVDPALPTLGLALVFAPTTLIRHFQVERQQRFIRQAFSRYVSPNLVDYLIAHPGSLELGGRRQRCSFVFADLAGFTALMETMDPTAAVSVLNRYLDGMISIAFEHEGTLDRIVGDAIAIVFSAPVEQADHERRALNCALAMHTFARRYVDDLSRQGVAFCETRIGVHTGEVTVGNFGGGAIFDYRALGDPVNTAARLEGANKYIGTLICVSEDTLAACAGVPVRPIGRLRLAGRTGYVMAYEPLMQGRDGEPSDPDYARAFELMRERDETAIDVFAGLAESRPADPLVSFHLRRLRAGQTGQEIEFLDK